MKWLPPENAGVMRNCAFGHQKLSLGYSEPIRQMPSAGLPMFVASSRASVSSGAQDHQRCRPQRSIHVLNMLTFWQVAQSGMMEFEHGPSASIAVVSATPDSFPIRVSSMPASRPPMDERVSCRSGRALWSSSRMRPMRSVIFAQRHAIHFSRISEEVRNSQRLENRSGSLASTGTLVPVSCSGCWR